MKTLMLLTTAILFCACGGKEPAEDAATDSPASEAEPFVDQARAAANEMGFELKKALTDAMQEGGAVDALGVCSVQAPEIAARTAAGTGLRVARVSERNRNPENVPTPAQAAVLQYFQTHPTVQDTVITENGTPTYMRAIRIGVDLCLQCHGGPADLADGTQAELAALYPQDKATGYAVGDLRGAFVVQRPVAGEE